MRDIFECGQVFRYKKITDGYAITAKDKYAEIVNTGNGAIVHTDTPHFFWHYLDLDTDYGKIIDTLNASFPQIKQATDFGQGIRILKQDIIEVIFSFIISANNNIKRIQLIIDRLCRELGQDMGGYYAFPTLESLAAADENFYRQIGAGFRDKYLCQTARTLLCEMPEFSADTYSARRQLTALSGIGNKVADCILLFGLGRTDVFPVDVWTERVYRHYFNGAKNRIQMAEQMTQTFKNLSGYAQQYLFHYFRQNRVQ